MARIDDYINAKKIAAESLAKESFEAILHGSGFEAAANNLFRIPFLNRTYRVGFPDFGFQDESEIEKEVPIQEQVLILHYLMGSPSISAPAGNWIAYREIPGAAFYFSAFVKRATDPLKKVFGRNTAGLLKAAEHLNAEKIEAGDAGLEFKIFPKIPLQMILWEGDNEFEPEGNILFDESIGQILSPEDAAWLAGMVVYRLMALSR
jgi:hypothetical protein